MSSAPVIAAAGLYTAPNQIAAPDGALVRADNCVIRSKGVVEPRRGHDLQTSPGSFGTVGVFQAGIQAALGSNIRNGAIFHQSNGSYGVAATLSRIYGTEFGGSLGSFDPPAPDQMRMRFARMLSRIYATTSAGPQRMLTQTTAAQHAGTVRPDMYGLPNVTTVLPDAGGFLLAGYSCAYRATVLSKDSQGRELQSEPSGRIVVSNPTSTAAIGGLVRTGGTTVTATTLTAHGLRPGDQFALSPGEANFGVGPYNVGTVTSAFVFTYASAGVNVASTVAQTVSPGPKALVTSGVFLPPTVTTSSVVRVARTVSTLGTPSEDYYLILERNLTAGEVAAKSLQFTDNTPDAVLGPIQYYSASADSLLHAKSLPPWCKTLEVVGDTNPRMAYANTRERQRRVIQLLSTVAASGGIQNNDTLVITRGAQVSTYTFKTSPNVALTEVFIATGGSPTKDIQTTALWLVDVINREYILSSNNTVRATYLSGPDDPPGLILLEATDDLTTAFTVNSAARPAAFNPQLATISSTQITHKNRVCYSEPSEPDAVPPLQYVDIGDPDEEILAVRQAMDVTFVLKERSAWAVSGDWPNLRIQRIDATIQLVAPDTAAVIGAQVYALTTQGVVAINNGSVGIIGLPVEDDLSFIAVTPAAKLAAWACGYDSERTYLLAVPTATTDTRAQKIYAYNTLEKTWTRWSTPSAGGFIDEFNNILRYGDANAVGQRYERKSYDRSDYFDESVASIQVTAVDSSTLATLGYSTLTIAAGANLDLVRVGDALLGTVGEWISTILAVDEVARTLRVSSSSYFTLSGLPLFCTTKRGFETVVEWVPDTAGDPSHAKQAQEAILHFQRFSGRAEVQVSSELAPAQVVSHTFSCPGFGLTPFGQAQFGDPSGPRNERTLITREAARGSYTSVKFRCVEGGQTWRLQGKTLEFTGPEKTRR